MTNTDTLISVVIPCFNQGRFLGDTLESVCAQTYNNWEGIIINDGSTDNTEEIALAYCRRDSRFKYIRQQNSGLSAARNAGIASANGSFIQLLDSDDLIEPGKLLSAIEAYQTQKTEAVIVYSSMRYFEHDAPGQLKILGRNSFLAHVELKWSDDLSAQTELIKTRNLCVVSAPVYPRNVFNNAGPFDENLTSLEDWDFHIRCLNSGYKFHHQYTNNALTLIRLHGTSMMRDQQLLDINYHKVILKHGIIPAVTHQATPPIATNLLSKIKISISRLFTL